MICLLRPHFASSNSQLQSVNASQYMRAMLIKGVTSKVAGYLTGYQTNRTLQFSLESKASLHVDLEIDDLIMIAIGAANLVLVLYLNTILTRQLYTHKCDVQSITITPDGSRVISGTAHGEVRACDVRTYTALGDTG